MSKLEPTNEASAMQKEISAIAEQGGGTTKVEQLIQQYCPDGVEYKPLKDILRIRNGRDYKHLDKGLIPVYGSGGIMTYVDTPMYSKPSVLILRKGSIDKLYYVDTPFWNVDTVFYTEIDTSKVVEKYVYYVLQKEHLEKLNTAGGVPSLTQGVLNEVLIPVPPLPVQEEIVRILDNFAELQAELQKRIQQYEYYRDKLLSFRDLSNWGGQEVSVEWKKLGDVVSISRGASPRPIQNYLTDEEDGIPWIKIGDVSTNSKYITSTAERITREGANKSRFLKKGTFILSNSMSFGRPYILGIDGCIHDGWISICDFEASLNSDFLYYLLRSSNVQGYWISKANSGGAVANLNSDIVRSTPIPVPPLAEQQRIVDILDRFNTLTTDLTAGLPAEIEARRKQYEYYRDQLLTFKQKA